MAAELVVSAHVDGRRRMWRGSSCGPALIQCSVRAMRVEVLDVLAQTMSRRRGPVIKEVVEGFPAQGADDPFCDRLARGRPDRGAMILMSAPGEHGVEGGGELAISVADQEPELVGAVAEVHQ
jgi:hypothetical protein